MIHLRKSSSQLSHKSLPPIDPNKWHEIIRLPLEDVGLSYLPYRKLSITIIWALVDTHILAAFGPIVVLGCCTVRAWLFICNQVSGWHQHWNRHVDGIAIDVNVDKARQSF